MKTFKTLGILLMLFSLKVSALSLREQLSQLNIYWNDHPLCHKVLDMEYRFTTDRDLIQLHLQFVENTLRINTGSGLSQKQKANRFKMLDELHHYWQEGTFPKNTGHSVRTPYFIDKWGTACAVGQLIISSGNESLAKQISVENNNGYIHNLVLEYPQIAAWAIEYGFTIDELAWIQPCYSGPVDTVGFKHPSCHSAWNGYFRPDFGPLQAPLFKSFYRFDGTTWAASMDMCGYWMFNRCTAGKYKWEVKDGANVIHTFTTELVAPPPATVSIIQSGDFSTCNGTISATAYGGVSPYRFFWNVSANTQTTSAITGVCEQPVYLYFGEACIGSGQYCPCANTFTIQTGIVSVKEESEPDIRLVPNPVMDLLWFEITKPFSSDNIPVRILSIHGALVLETSINTSSTAIDLSQLSPGLYFLKLGNFKVKRIVKN